MSKNFFQDVVRYGKKARENALSVHPERAGNQGGKSKNAIWFIAAVSLVFFFFALSFLFSSATVTIVPKIKNLEVNASFSASKDSSVKDELSFEMVAVKGDAQKDITSSSQRYSDKKAIGRVILYNKTDTAQVLVAETRLMGTNDKIYKLDSKISVPGASSNGPGSVEIGVHAAEAGADYNTLPIDFTVVGFKGTPKYDKFYARSKGNIFGGIIGQVYVISADERSKALAELNFTLKAKLLKKAMDESPKGFILYKDAVFLETDETSSSLESQSASVPVILNGSLYGFLFNEKELSGKVFSSVSSGDVAKSDIAIPNIRDLVFSLSNKDPNSFDEVKRISFTLTGKAKAVWNVNSKSLLQSLLGQRKSDFKNILSSYGGVESADLSIKPIWKMSLPEKESKINIIIKTP